MTKTTIAVLSMLFIARHASADLASKNYVDSNMAKAVSTEKSADQTLAGRYSVTGTIEVETPNLPTALN